MRVCLFYTVLCVCVSARANARSCLCTRGYMAVIALPLIYVCIGLGCVILLREIISSNVRWPDSLPVLCSFRCINILKESPGETESLCKHNCHESVALCTLGLINRMKMDKICTHSMLIHLRRGDLLYVLHFWTKLLPSLLHCYAIYKFSLLMCETFYGCSFKAAVTAELILKIVKINETSISLVSIHWCQIIYRSDNTVC